MNMPIRVEFFGIPRQRAGVATTTAEGQRLGDVLAELEHKFPGLAESCIRAGRLKSGYTANLGGDRFVTDPETELAADDVLLILSADAGG
ncbi:MAG: MoaD/ThiS family protein [Planctomycetota bacterium]|nr:MoaD/ThiS family protein [Planctomycetota bacterium]